MSNHSSNDKTLFSKIIDRDIPADIVYENERIIAFRDIAPLAPTHILIVPKKPIKNIQEASSSDQQLLGEILLVGQEIARKYGIHENFRLVTNSGSNAGQSVFHLHFHLLGGKALGPFC